MDKTIEERAKKASEGYDDEGYSAGIYVGYKEGATEQEQITKKDMIEKACEARCKLCWCEINKACPYNNRDECYTRNDFRKTLEK